LRDQYLVKEIHQKSTLPVLRKKGNDVGGSKNTLLRSAKRKKEVGANSEIIVSKKGSALVALKNSKKGGTG